MKNTKKKKNRKCYLQNHHRLPQIFQLRQLHSNIDQQNTDRWWKLKILSQKVQINKMKLLDHLLTDSTEKLHAKKSIEEEKETVLN